MEHLLSIGDCISLSFRQCRRDIRFLIRKLLLPSIIELFGKFLLLWAARVFLATLRHGPQPDMILAIILGTLGLAISIPAEVWLTMRQLAYVRMLVLRRDDYEAAYKEVRGKFWAVIVFAISFYVAFMVWVFFWGLLFGIVSVVAKAASLALIMVPVILLMMIAAGISLVPLLLPLALVFVILACEDTGVVQVFLRSFKMTFRRFFPTLGFVCVLFTSWVAVHFALTSVLQVLYGVEYFRSGVYTGKVMASEVQVPLYVQLIAGAWNSIVSMYMMPMFFVACGYFYYSLRMREEGLDFSHSVDHLERKRNAIPG